MPLNPRKQADCSLWHGAGITISTYPRENYSRKLDNCKVWKARHLYRTLRASQPLAPHGMVIASKSPTGLCATTLLLSILTGEDSTPWLLSTAHYGSNKQFGKRKAGTYLIFSRAKAHCRHVGYRTSWSKFSHSLPPAQRIERAISSRKFGFA